GATSESTQGFLKREEIRLRLQGGNANHGGGGGRSRGRRRLHHQPPLQPPQPKRLVGVRSAPPVRLLRLLHHAQMERWFSRHEGTILDRSRLADWRVAALCERITDFFAGFHE